LSTAEDHDDEGGDADDFGSNAAQGSEDEYEGEQSKMKQDFGDEYEYDRERLLPGDENEEVSGMSHRGLGRRKELTPVHDEDEVHAQPSLEMEMHDHPRHHGLRRRGNRQEISDDETGTY